MVKRGRISEDEKKRISKRSGDSIILMMNRISPKEAQILQARQEALAGCDAIYPSKARNRLCVWGIFNTEKKLRDEFKIKRTRKKINPQ